MKITFDLTKIKYVEIEHDEEFTKESYKKLLDTIKEQYPDWSISKVWGSHINDDGSKTEMDISWYLS